MVVGSIIALIGTGLKMDSFFFGIIVPQKMDEKDMRSRAMAYMMRSNVAAKKPGSWHS